MQQFDIAETFLLYFTQVLIQNILEMENERSCTTDSLEDMLMNGMCWGVAERGRKEAPSETITARGHV